MPPDGLVRAIVELEGAEVLKAVDPRHAGTTTQAVRCLECGCEYLLIRRHRRGLQANVCPRCSYAGWEPVGRPAAPRTADDGPEMHDPPRTGQRSGVHPRAIS